MPAKDQLKATLQTLENKKRENEKAIEKCADKVEERIQRLSLFQMFGTGGKVPDADEEVKIEDMKEKLRYDDAKLGILRERKSKLERDIEMAKEDIRKKKEME